MEWIILKFENIPLILCGIFYAVLCIFSLGTGLIYMSGKRELNPLELPDSFVNSLSDLEKRQRFAKKMGLVTFIVGIVQGLTALCIFRGSSPLCYAVAVGFTVFSIASVVFKLKGRISAFALLKFVAYTVILVILVLPSSRALFL